MKERTMLVTASCLSVLLFLTHVADDIVRGIEEGNASNLPAILIFTVWLYGTLVLRDKKAGYVIMLLGGLFALVVPYLHMSGVGVGVNSRIGKQGDSFLFVWTLLAIGTTGLFSFILAVQGLWRWKRDH